ncbi:MAG: polysaccharide deacetylase family protein [Firmicutes bacterium]|jgi:peptidoglycan/xylan/chitin deacetylase (PgdA/CDA1 family)|nr:polysaccharide deacetylase family protein [Bacillota bacterium]
MKIRKLTAILIAIAMFFVTALLLISFAAAPNSRIEVLLYHELEPGGSQEWPIIDPEDFYSHINTLLEHGWEPITLGDFALWQQNKLKVTNKSFLLTFDDGGESIYKYAYPYLLEKQIPATIFLIAKYHDPDYVLTEEVIPPKLTVDQIQEMSQSGIISFQSHSYDLHREINGKPAILALPPERVLADFKRSRQVINRLTGEKVNSIAYPSGTVDQEIIKLAREAGFELGFAGNIQGAASKKEAMSTKRFPLDNLSPDVFSYYYETFDRQHPKPPFLLLRKLYRKIVVSGKTLWNI